MSKFKIGDKVTCIETNEKEAADNGITYGKTYRVVDIDRVGKENEWLLYLDSGETAYCYRFKLYKESEMTAEQLREEILRIDTRIEEAKKDIESAEKERHSLVEKLREKGFTLARSQQETDGGYNKCTVENVNVGDTLSMVSDSWNKDITSGEDVIVIGNDKSRLPFKVMSTETGEEDWTLVGSVKFK